MQILPPFTLYGLIGCPHCASAERFLQSKLVPYIIVVANGDPVADSGIKKLFETEQAEYPVLVSRVTNEVKKGFVEGEYERMVQDFISRNVAGASSVFGSEQQLSGEVQAKAAEATAGAN